MTEAETAVLDEAPDSLERLPDLGLGRVAAQRGRGRFLSKDGTPRSRKFGVGPQRWEKLYRRALDASWPTFLLWLFGIELLINGIFAIGYRAPQDVSGVANSASALSATQATESESETAVNEVVASTIAALAQPGDYVICLGAGDITYWAYALPEQLGEFFTRSKGNAA